MTVRRDNIPPELRYRIEEVAHQCRSVRALRAWTQFGLTLAALTLIFTVFLYLTPTGAGLASTLAALYLVAVAIAAWRLLWRPLRKPITLEQVALHIDRRHPELEDRIVSAVQFASDHDGRSSEWIIEQFLQDTLPKVRKTSFDDLLDPFSVLRLGAAVALLLLATGAVVILFRGVWFPSLGGALPVAIAPLNRLPFTVEPGNARVRRGDNQMIWVRSDQPDRVVSIRYRMPGGNWQAAEAVQSGTEKGYYHLFSNVQQDIEYQAQFGRHRSEVFRLTAWTPPEVDSIDLVYHYPEYLGKESREVPNSGNISAVEGTEVELHVAVNKRLQTAELALGSGESVPLTRASEGNWTTALTISRDDTYEVRLKDAEGAPSEFNPEYTITAKRDDPPEIRIEFPRGDGEVTLLEEVPFEFKVSDDNGFTEYGIQYEIIGEEPVRVALNPGGEMIEAATGNHQLMLEELDLGVGDAITWTVYARDTKPDRSDFEMLGDPYFLDIRPFSRQYREAMSAGGGGAGAGAGGQDGELIQLQREIIIATWNLRKDLRYVDEEEFNERMVTIKESQSSVGARIDEAMGEPGPEVLQLKQAVGNAVQALDGATFSDPRRGLSEATTYEQQAYRMMLKLRPEESQVQQMRSQGGGGGGGGNQRPDIDELELDRNRNFYEQQSVTREEQQAADEFLSKLKQLAQRQQAINEEIAKLISEMQQAKTEEERNEIQRKLERLEEELEKNLDRLDQVAQETSESQMNPDQARDAQDMLQRAREQMNRSLEQMQGGQIQQARSSGARAMNTLQDLEEQIEQLTRSASEQRMENLLERMQEIAQTQSEIAEKSAQAQEQHDSPSLDGQEEAERLKQELEEQRLQQRQDFVETMEEAAELAERSRQSQELMARKLGDWLRQTARDGILEDMEEVDRYFEYGIWETVTREESDIAEKLARAAEGLEEVARSLVGDDVEGMQKALEHLDRLAEDLGEPANQEDEQGQEPGATGNETGEEQQGAAPGEEEDPQRPGASGEGEENAEEGRSRIAQRDQPQNPQESAQNNEGNQPSGQGERTQDGQQRQGQTQRGRAGGDRDASPWGQYGGANGMRDFVENDYQDWLEELRNAEALLPENDPIRDEVRRIRERIEGMRRQWRDRRLQPQYDLFLEYVADPLINAQAQLQQEIEKRLGQAEFLLADEGDIPERYRRPVAEYFKALSEAEGLL